MFGISVLVASFYISSVFTLEPIPFKLREISNSSIWTGVESRIYGGQVANEGEFKFMIFALIKLPGGSLSQCSASLINENWVLLAAHCVYFKNLQSRDIILVGGKAHLQDYIMERLRTDYYVPVDERLHGLQERRAENFFIHPKYNDKDLYHDVAIIKLKKPFDSNYATTIPLSKDEIKFEKTCMILGWGLTRGNIQTYKLNFVSDKKVRTTKLKCLAKFKGAFICLRPDFRGICQGDSGSPLVCDGKVWGVASHYISDQIEPDCGDSIEEYYTELYPDIKWLEDTMAGSGNKSTAINSIFVLTCAFSALWLFAKTPTIFTL